MSVSVTCPVYTLAAVSSADVAAAASWDPTPAQMAQVAFARRRRGRRVAGWGAFVLFVVGAACLLFPPGLIVVIPVALGLFAWAGVLYATPGKVSRATNAEAAFRDFFSGFSSVYTRGVSTGLMWDEADLAFVLLTPAARDEAAEVDRLRETWRAFWTSIAVEGSEATAD
ncbi:MAG: hypothetical protein NDJ94_06610, partial [Vicinamibacteria bacterium]|nr:hypothetical protein [Vicinamibacteria bacterium]